MKKEKKTGSIKISNSLLKKLDRIREHKRINYGIPKSKTDMVDKALSIWIEKEFKNKNIKGV